MPMAIEIQIARVQPDSEWLFRISRDPKEAGKFISAFWETIYVYPEGVYNDALVKEPYFPLVKLIVKPDGTGGCFVRKPGKNGPDGLQHEVWEVTELHEEQKDPCLIFKIPDAPPYAPSMARVQWVKIPNPREFKYIPNLFHQAA